MVLCMYIPLHIQTFLKMKCLVVRCAIPIPQRIWFKGEVGGFVLFNFAENCPAHPSSAISQFSVGGGKSNQRAYQHDSLNGWVRCCGYKHVSKEPIPFQNEKDDFPPTTA